jgi:hypothetical protein
VPGEAQFTGAPPAEGQLAEPPPGAGLPPGLLQ